MVFEPASPLDALAGLQSAVETQRGFDSPVKSSRLQTSSTVPFDTPVAHTKSTMTMLLQRQQTAALLFNYTGLGARIAVLSTEYLLHNIK